MRLRTKGSYIRGLRETERPRSSKGKWVYLGILALLAVWLVYVLVGGVFHVRGNGQIILPKLDIQHAADIRIKKFHVEEGEEVETGDPLFDYVEERMMTRYEREVIKTPNPGRIADFEAKKIERDFARREVQEMQRRRELLLRIISYVEKDHLPDAEEAKVQEASWPELIAILAELETKREELGLSEKDLARAQGQYRKMDELYRLDAYVLSDLWKKKEEIEKKEISLGRIKVELRKMKLELRVVLEDVEHRIEEAKTSEEKLSEEILALKDNLHSLHHVNRPVEVKVEEEGVFTSPLSGTIVRIFFEDHEVALKGEPIMGIYRSGDPVIKAFFDQKYVGYLKEGDRITVDYPDGSKGDGVIRRIYIATFSKPPEFQGRYEPLDRSIVADIVLPGSSLSKAARFYKLQVKVHKRKFF